MTIKAICLYAGLGLTGVIPAAATAGVPPAIENFLPKASNSGGPSVVTVGDRNISVAGQVGYAFLPKHSPVLVLPDGDPPLPADLFDAIPLADGRTGYAVKNGAKVEVTVSYIAPPRTLVPEELLSAITPDPAAATAKAGTFHAGDILVSVPYRYKTPLRLKDDFRRSGLFSDKHLLGIKGETGFDAGSFDARDGKPHHLYCFFNQTRPNPYDAPDCFDTSDEGATLSDVSVQSNIPLHYSQQGYSTHDNPAFGIDKDDVVIAHDFHLDLVAGDWESSGFDYDVHWQSEGVRVSDDIISTASDGTARLPVGNGFLILRHDPGNKTAVVTEFQTEPAASVAKP